MRKLLLGTLSLILLSSCGSKEEASNSNFKTAINNYLQEQGCANSIDMMRLASGKGYPIKLYLDLDNHYVSAKTLKEAQAKLDTFVRIGIFSVTERSVSKKEAYGWVPPHDMHKTVTLRSYDLTDLGKKSISKDGAICLSHEKVSQIINFTKPATAEGETISEVWYSTIPTDIPKWARDDSFEKEFGFDPTKMSQSKRTTLLLTNNGWIDRRGSGS